MKHQPEISAISKLVQISYIAMHCGCVCVQQMVKHIPIFLWNYNAHFSFLLQKCIIGAMNEQYQYLYIFPMTSACFFILIKVSLIPNIRILTNLICYLSYWARSTFIAAEWLSFHLPFAISRTTTLTTYRKWLYLTHQ